MIPANGDRWPERYLVVDLEALARVARARVRGRYIDDEMTDRYGECLRVNLDPDNRVVDLTDLLELFDAAGFAPPAALDAAFRVFARAARHRIPDTPDPDFDRWRPTVAGRLAALPPADRFDALESAHEHCPTLVPPDEILAVVRWFARTGRPIPTERFVPVTVDLLASATYTSIESAWVDLETAAPGLLARSEATADDLVTACAEGAPDATGYDAGLAAALTMVGSGRMEYQRGPLARLSESRTGRAPLGPSSDQLPRCPHPFRSIRDRRSGPGGTWVGRRLHRNRPPIG